MRTRRHPRPNAGFTLIEIMAVILIIGLLVSTVGRNVLGSLFTAKRTVAERQIKEFEGALTQYKMIYGKYPDSLEVLTEPDPELGDEPFIEKIPLDPWGYEYDYDIEDGKPVIISYGADGARGGEGEDADISNLDEE